MNAPADLAAWLREGPFALAMSSGFFGFFAHCGMLMALTEHGLEPERLSGSSAGALIAGLYGAGMTPADIARVLRELRREDFWDPFPGPGLLRGRRFRAILEHHLPVTTLEQCRRPVSVSVCDVLGWRTRALNQGPLATALHASCSVPLMFHPVWINGRPYIDGGVTDRAGVAGLPVGTRILHHHLGSRSPWRRPGSPALRPPQRAGLISFTIQGLRRAGPSRMHYGLLALDQARAATHAALEMPLDDVPVAQAGHILEVAQTKEKGP